LGRETHVPKVLDENARDNVVKESLDIEEDCEGGGPIQEGSLNSIGKADEVINA